jgi:uncharacterized phage protein (TIGR01671 family)
MNQRPIKFRVWEEIKNIMLYPDTVSFDNEGKVYSVEDIRYQQLFSMFVDPYNVIAMQFTGLHDKNGKEVWEGDIFVWKEVGVEIGMGVVVYDDESASFRVKCKDYYIDTLADTPGNWFPHILGEVIGNIYENPELLGDKKGDCNE